MRIMAINLQQDQCKQQKQQNFGMIIVPRNLFEKAPSLSKYLTTDEFAKQTTHTDRLAENLKSRICEMMGGDHLIGLFTEKEKNQLYNVCESSYAMRKLSQWISATKPKTELEISVFNVKTNRTESDIVNCQQQIATWEAELSSLKEDRSAILKEFGLE